MHVSGSVGRRRTEVVPSLDRPTLGRMGQLATLRSHRPVLSGASARAPGSILTPGPLSGRSLVSVPVVAAHRGASGHRPEHTLAAHRTALRMGADQIELDIVMTADGVPLVRHENELSRSTDVALKPQFRHRRSRRMVDGTRQCGWFAEDFTLVEVKQLGAREPGPALRPRNTRYDGLEAPATLSEVLAAVGAESVRRGRAAGVLVEIKHAHHLSVRGLDPVPAVLSVLRRHGLDHPLSGVTLMSFEPSVLRRCASLTRLPVVQLIGDPGGRPADALALGGTTDYAAMLAPRGLDEVDEYADGIGVERRWVLPRTRGAGPVRPTGLVEAAHRRDLTVQVWTLRAENAHLPARFRSGGPSGEIGDMASEVVAFLRAGVDGVTTDHPALAIEGLRRHLDLLVEN